jgi:F-type H+-transporting ATPase subunit b
MWKHFLLLLALLSLLLAVPVALAQDGEGEGEAVEEDAAEAGEADHEEAVAEVSTSPLTPLGINLGFLLAQIINFGLIAVLLGVGLWRPLVNMLDSRAAKIQKGLEDAAAAAQARQSAEADAEKILADARLEAAKLIEEARSRGEELAKSIESEARTEAEGHRDESRQRANEERDRQLADLRGQVVGVATAMARRLITDSVDEKGQQKIVSDFLANVPAEAGQLSGRVEVISAMPLNDDEQKSVRGKLGSAGEVVFSVDPGILGGLVIRSEDRVVDASVRSGLGELAGGLR